MKINIQIEDATPEEAQKVLANLGIQRSAPANRKGRVENLDNPIWTDEEKDAIRGCKDGQEAIKAYREKFPISSRTIPAIKRQLLSLQKSAADPTCIEETGCAGCEHTGLTDACDKCSPPLTGKEAPVMPETNQYGIPKSIYKTDKKLYQRLWARCKAKGIKYSEALNLERKPLAQTPPENTAVKKPRKAPVKKPRLPFHQTTAGGSASSDTNSQTITAGAPAASSTLQKLNNTIIKQNGTLKAGQRVRHNGSKVSPHFGKEGEILNVEENGQVFVKFGETSTWLSPHLVAVVQGASTA